jgi:hypothetical protein
MVRWAETDSDVRHCSKIAQECLKAMTALRPYLAVTLRDKTIVYGWLAGLTQGHNADEDEIPTAWRGSIILQDDDREIEFDFREVETVCSWPATVRLDDIGPTSSTPAKPGKRMTRRGHAGQGRSSAPRPARRSRPTDLKPPRRSL